MKSMAYVRSSEVTLKILHLDLYSYHVVCEKNVKSKSKDCEILN